MRILPCCLLLFCSALPAQGTAAERFLLGLGAVGSVETAFVESSAKTLATLAAAPEIAGLEQRHAAHASVTVRLVALEAAARGAAGLAAYTEALRGTDQARATWALAHLETADLAGQLQLHSVASASGGEWRRAALDALQRLRGAPRRQLIAALLARPLELSGVAVLAELAGLPAGTALAELLPCLYADAHIAEQLPVAARAAGPLALPAEALVLSAETLERLLPVALPAHVPFLLATAPSVAAAQRVALARTLTRLAHPAGALLLHEALSASSASERTAAFEAAGEFGVALPTQALLAAIIDVDATVRWSAVGAAHRTNCVLPVAEASMILGSVPADVAEDFVVLALRHADAASAEDFLLKAVDSEENFAAPEVAAELLLARATGPQHVMTLLQHPSAVVRTLALASLRRAPWNETLFGALETATGDAQALVRATAALTLGSQRSDRNRSKLLSMVRDSAALVRECAALALAQQENWHIVPALRTLLQDEDRSVRNAAALALLQHGLDDVRTILQQDAALVWLRQRTEQALAASPEGARR